MNADICIFPNALRLDFLLKERTIVQKSLDNRFCMAEEKVVICHIGTANKPTTEMFQ